MIRFIALAAALVAASTANVRAHDISQDWAYTNPSDGAHWCHHLRVAYWTESAELTSEKSRLALVKVKLLRARHARPSKETEDYLKGRVTAIERTVKHSADILLLLNAAASSEKLGCQPWPG